MVSKPAAARVTIGEVARDVDEELALATLSQLEPGACLLSTPGVTTRVLWSVSGSDPSEWSDTVRLEVVVDGWRFEAVAEPLVRARLRDRARRGAAAALAHAPLVLRAPIPGRIGGIRVTQGQAVEEGTALLTLEAMKMENVVRAPRPGTITRVAVAAGQTVELGDPLVELR